jgi:preprotein translocase SecE subunit
MAVKKKEKATTGRQSESSDSRKGIASMLSTKPVKSKHGGDADKAKTKTKASSPQKMKSGEEKREVKQDSQNLPFVGTLVEARQFLNEVWTEFCKISWPERSQIIRETVSVLFLVALITVFVWLFDIVLGKFVFAPVEHWGHLYGIGGGA